VADKEYRPPEGYLTMAQAEQHLGMSRMTLLAFIRDAGIRAYRDPRNKRVRLLKVEDLERGSQPIPEDAPGQLVAALAS
jgi:hypothetical protein